MSIPIFDLRFSESEIEQFIAGSKQIFQEAHFSNHTFSQAFELAFAKKYHAQNALFVNSGTAALECALHTLDLRGKFVIVPTNTFIATAVAIENAGGTPYILDIENEWFGLDPLELEKALHHLGHNRVGAILPVHIGGHIAPSFLKVKSLAEQFSIPLIEDCAQAHFAQIDQQYAGSFGQAGCFSFYTTKIMTTGEGGMVICHDPDDYNKLISIRRFGMSATNSLSHETSGSNYKATEFAALLGTIELQRVEERIQKRREIAARYQKLLNPKFFRALGDPPNGTNTHYKQIVLSHLGRREEIVQILKQHNIAVTGGVYYMPLHQQPRMRSYVLEQSYPIADKFCGQHFCPPCFPEIELENIDLTCEILNSWGQNQ